MTLDSLIEAVLFFKGEAVSVSWLAKTLAKEENEIGDALNVLENSLKTRGLRLQRLGDEVTVVTAPEASAVIEQITKEELTRDLGKAGLETLSVVLYRGPVSRKEIDFIRGVNSNFVLRNLIMRGLVEKVSSEKDQRSFLYKPTLQLLSFLGLSKIEDVPEYEKVRGEIEKFKNQEKSESSEMTEE